MKQKTLLTCILIFLLVAFPRPVLAARGTPDTPYFGYGLRLNVNSATIEESLRWAAENKLDWVALDFDWAVNWPTPIRWEGNSAFGRAARLANSQGITLAISITNPPSWAMTPQGPNPELTIILTQHLKKLYPNLLAVELYPNANTRAGWGATPNAGHYAALFQQTENTLKTRGINLYLMAGGLSNQTELAEDQEDALYLQQLYDSGLKPEIISLRLKNLSGAPVDEPLQANALRHFERIRQIMVVNNQSNALIWVTGFDIPTELKNASAEQQSEWLANAYLLMRSRLYFGSAFYACADALSPQVKTCFLEQNNAKNPFFLRLENLVREN